MSPDAARRKVRQAVLSGQLVRPDACSRCGDVPKTTDGRSAIQGHHHDYEKPLDVEWLCAKCHRKETPLPKVMGAPTFGSRNGQARLSNDLVLVAREKRAEGLSYQKIADQLGVHKMTAMRAIKGVHWAAAPSPEKQG